MPRFLIATDAFKDALSAPAVCAAIAEGLKQFDPNVQVRTFPLADGGEGTFAVLAEHLRLKTVQVDACDPLRRSLRSTYGLSADGRTAFVELAETAGLPLLTPAERNPWHTTTFGMGQQIADAARRGAQALVVAIGGSATNDAGMGIAAALGWRFLDAEGRVLPPVGGSLGEVMRIEPPKQPLFFEQVKVMCDVNNPLYGPQGAAQVYAAQKGADEAMISRLNAGLRHFAQVAQTVRPLDPNAAGSGAAGGVGFGLRLFLNATLQRGIDLILDLTHFDQALQAADWIITGEGKLDAQTAHGKLIHGICHRAATYGKPVVALCGQLDAEPSLLQRLGLCTAFSINPPAMTHLPTLLANTAPHLKRTAYESVYPFVLANGARQDTN